MNAEQFNDHLSKLYLEPLPEVFLRWFSRLIIAPVSLGDFIDNKLVEGDALL
jgi:hypothetical protein